MHSETHTACKKRLRELGDQARCCYCVPHEGCEINQAENKELDNDYPYPRTKKN